MTIIVSKKLDCRWIYEPFYFFPLKHTLSTMNEGEVLEFWVNDQGSRLDMQAWCNMTGHTLIEMRNKEEYFQFFIQKPIKEVSMAEYTINSTLDCRGLMCPMPVVKTNKAIKNIQVGEILEMISTDPGSIPDMQAWAKQTGHELLEAKEENSEYRFVIRKTH